MPTLLVAPADSLLAYVEKGELKPRYFNPRDLFEHVHVLEPSSSDTCPPAARLLFGDADVTVHPVGTVDWWSVRRGPLSSWRARRARDVALAVAPDVIRSYDPLAGGLLARVAAQSARRPWVVSVHTNFDVDVRANLLRRRRWRGVALHWITRWAVEHRVLRDATRVIAAYGFVADYVRVMGRHDVRIIYNRADPSHFRPHIGTARRGTRVRGITVGSAIPERGLALVIEAVARTECELIVVGRGPERPMLERLARDLGIEARVRFVDRVPNADLPAVYGDADLYISGLGIGGVSIPVLEAAASGLPLIGVRPYPGVEPEIVDQLGMVTDRDPVSLADAIRRLANDPDERTRLGRRAREWSETRPDPELQEAALYQELL
jgi:glycosyltransferase involved in cell wall biosynthesis